MYVLCLALHPTYKGVAVSKFYTYEKLQPYLGNLLKKLGIPLGIANHVISGFKKYLSGNDFVNISSSNGTTVCAYKWWSDLHDHSTTNCLKELSKISMLLFGITPHAADTDRLFSVLGYNHNKTHNSLLYMH